MLAFCEFLEGLAALFYAVPVSQVFKCSLKFGSKEFLWSGQESAIFKFLQGRVQRAKFFQGFYFEGTPDWIWLVLSLESATVSFNDGSLRVKV